MSKMAELSYDMEQLYIEGMSAKQIAQELMCPIELVLGFLEELGVADSPQEVFDPFETINS
jgi:hypothetical protein